MAAETDSADRLRSILVMLATAGMIAFNSLAATGLVNGITPKEISDRYPTPITPSDYAFTIWILIYFGLAVFSVFQIFPSNRARFRGVRALYIISCVLNCGWILFWHHDRPGICLVLIALLAIILAVITFRFIAADGAAERVSKMAFGLYAGWVTVAALINFFVLLDANGISLSADTNAVLGVGAIIIATLLAIIVAWRLKNYLFPLAIAWALTAIAINESGNTAVVVANAIGVILSLLASVSFIIYLPTVNVPRNQR